MLKFTVSMPDRGYISRATGLADRFIEEYPDKLSYRTRHTAADMVLFKFKTGDVWRVYGSPDHIHVIFVRMDKPDEEIVDGNQA